MMDELQTEAGKRHVARADAIYSKPRDEDGYRLLVTRYSDLLAIEAEAIAIGAAQERERLRDKSEGIARAGFHVTLEWRDELDALLADPETR